MLILLILLFLIVIFWPENEYFSVKPSKIHGVGMYADKSYSFGEKLFICIDEYRKVTPLGKKVNHCGNKANTKVKEENGVWWLVADKNIKNGDELVANYYDTPSFIDKPNPEWRC